MAQAETGTSHERETATRTGIGEKSSSSEVYAHEDDEAVMSLLGESSSSEATADRKPAPGSQDIALPLHIHTSSLDIETGRIVDESAHISTVDAFQLTDLRSDIQSTELYPEFPGPDAAEQTTEEASPTPIGAHLTSDPSVLRGLSETCRDADMSEPMEIRDDLRVENHSSSDLERSSNCQALEDIIPAVPSPALSSPPLVLYTYSEVDAASKTQLEGAQETRSTVLLECRPNDSYSPSPNGAGGAHVYMLSSLTAASEGQLGDAPNVPESSSLPTGGVTDATMDPALAGGATRCDLADKEDGEETSVIPDTAEISYPVCCDEDLHLRDALDISNDSDDATRDLPAAAGATGTDMNVSRPLPCKEPEQPSAIKPTPSVDLAGVMSAPASPIDMDDTATAPVPLAAPIPSAVLFFDFSCTPGDDSATEAQSGLVNSDCIPAPLLDQARTSASCCFENSASRAESVPHIIVTPATPQISSALLYESSEPASAGLVSNLTMCNNTLLSVPSATSHDFSILEASSTSVDGPNSDAVLGPFPTKTNDEDLTSSRWSDALDMPLNSLNPRPSLDEDELDSTGPTYEHFRRSMNTSGLTPQAISHCSSDPTSQTPGLQEVKDDHAEYASIEDAVEKVITTSDEDAMDDSLPSSSPPSSSQPRASSPDRVFSSSPPRFMFNSPPTSPRVTGGDYDLSKLKEEEHILLGPAIDNAAALQTSLGKHEAERAFLTPEHRAEKRFKPEDLLSLPPPPNPKRPTQASQKRQFKKLVKPFRSPLVNYQDVLSGKDGVYASGYTGHASMPLRKQTYPKATADDEASSEIPERIKDHTANTAKPFRLPTAAPSSSRSVTISTDRLVKQSSVLNAPTIQSLQARVQKLKQALKIMCEQVSGDDDHKLASLVTKWRTTGREVAWLVWDTVKDLEPSAAAMGASALPARGGWDEQETPFGSRAKKNSQKGPGGWGFQAGWGYDDRKSGSAGSWGWDEKGGGDAQGEHEAEEKMEVCDDEQTTQPHTLGTMLRHIGIDPATLGWDEDEGDFVGDP